MSDFRADDILSIAIIILSLAVTVANIAYYFRSGDKTLYRDIKLAYAVNTLIVAMLYILVFFHVALSNLYMRVTILLTIINICAGSYISWLKIYIDGKVSPYGRRHDDI